MASHVSVQKLTPSLEDYLETLYELLRTRKVVRVKDIARACEVKASSVSPAMQRLAALGLISYERREYIELTRAGEEAARRVLSRHQILTAFLTEILEMPTDTAESDACAMEHHISDDAMERLVRLFEFLRACPKGDPSFLTRFHAWGERQPGEPPETHPCADRFESTGPVEHRTSLSALTPGETGLVRRVDARGAIRQRLLDMGLLPDAPVRVERVAPSGDPIWIRLRGYQLSLRKSEASAVIVTPQ